MEIGLKLKANIIKEYLQGSSLNDLSIKYNIDIELGCLNFHKNV
ncbi:MAG: hypothetical protein RXP98_06935 [Thermoplasmata archaeon]